MSGNGNHREAAVKRYSKKSNEVALSVQDTRPVFSTPLISDLEDFNRAVS